MATIRKFEDLDIWQEARGFFQEIHKLCIGTDLKNDFGIKNQVRASCGSIMDNIAEGFERGGNLEFRQFLSVAKGSAGETRSQLYRILDSGYIKESTFGDLKNRIENLSGKIHNLMRYLNRQDYKGNKFKSE